LETTSTKTKRPAGMTGFSIVFAGQLISMIATQMTGFALTLWIYQSTSSATALGLAQVFFIVPFLIISPIAGVMVDRYNRKMMMMVSDIGAGVVTTVILVLQVTGGLQLWHLYAANMAYGLVNAFQWPAYSAAITTMVSKEQYGRANGMMSLIDAGPGVIAPLLAAALIGFIKLTGILAIDIVTYGIAILSLVIVFVPQPRQTAEGQQAKSNIWRESLFGFKYIFLRPGLLGLLVVFMCTNLFNGMAFTLFAPEILSRTGNNSVMMGTVQSAASIAAVLGAIIMSAWGGFKHRVNGVIWGIFCSGLLGFTFFGFGHSLAIWIPAAMLMAIFGPLTGGSSQAIWQSKVAPDLQGRVFSARRLIAWITQPIAPMIAGPLADYVLEPAMKTHTGLSAVFGGVFGIGPGAGMGLLITMCGIGTTLVALAANFYRPIREVETILPDHD
jgi:MFS transporter, DHA3 family, macrolide efflux protein